MFKRKAYDSVVEMVRDTTDDPSLVSDLERHIFERRLVCQLFVSRCVRGLSQKDVAEKMGCTQGRISKLEASRDEDLRLGDIQSYAQALGLTTILGLEGGPSAVARVKFHHACIKKEVDALTKLTVRDEKVAEGVSRFFNEAALHFLTTLEEATKRLPPEDQTLGVSYSIDIVGPTDEGCTAEQQESEKPKRKAPRESRTRSTKIKC